MPLEVVLDAEELVGRWLREHADILILDARVAGGTPNSTTRPWIRVTQLDASPVQRARFEHYMDYMLQLDCYAGGSATRDFMGQREASLLARTARAILKDIEGSVTVDAVIARVRFTTHMRAPDTDMEPARERYVVTAHLLMRPA